jgi:hypothetical protein
LLDESKKRFQNVDDESANSPMFLELPDSLSRKSATAILPDSLNRKRSSTALPDDVNQKGTSTALELPAQQQRELEQQHELKQVDKGSGLPEAHTNE